MVNDCKECLALARSYSSSAHPVIWAATINGKPAFVDGVAAHCDPCKALVARLNAPMDGKFKTSSLKRQMP